MENTQIFERRRREMNKGITDEIPAQNVERKVMNPTPIRNTYRDQAPITEPASVDTPRVEGGEFKMRLVFPITAVLAVIIAAYFTFMFTSSQAKQVENEARYQCAQSSRYTVDKSGTTIWYPAEELYTACLDEKGVK